MDRILKIMMAAAVVPLLLTACSKEEPKQAEPVKKVQSAKKAQDSAALDTTAGVEPTHDAKRRNPFQSYIVVMKGAEEGAVKTVKGPLECCELNAFRLVAVVNSPENAFALLQAPDAKRYIVRKGDKLGSNEGKVIKIGINRITVREPNKDEKGNVLSTTDIDMTLQAERAKEGKR